MKKLIVLLSVCFIILFLKKTEAYSGNGFIWNKDEISIPINSNFDSYISEFEVEFYYNGKVTDEDVLVELDTFYYGSLNISTNTVCDKNVSLIAYVSGYSNYDRKTVVVHIIDEIAPVIKCVKTLSLNITDDFDPSKYFIITDNDEINTSSITYEYDKRELLIVGKHQITVSASDINGNYASRVFSYVVTDLSSPLISLASSIEIEYGDLDFDILDYASAYDDYDGDLSSAITYTGLDLYKLGKQEITITVKDSNGNISTTKKDITVVDFKAPVLELITYEDTIDISDVNNIDFKTYISKVSDNCTNLSSSDVEIDYSNFTYNVGQSEIYYLLTDEEGNYSKRSLLIDVRYSTEPIITCSDLSFKVGESFDLNDYVKVESDYDSNVEYNYYIDESVLNRSEVGTYEVIIESMDYAGNKTSKKIYVTITNNDDSSLLNDLNNIYDLFYQYKIILIGFFISISIFIEYSIEKKKRKIEI